MLEPFKSFHPLFVEGMSGYDERDPQRVAQVVVSSLRVHWEAHPPTKPVLLMLQGDPLTERGISAITRIVARELGIQRGLIVLDDAIADYHSQNADRDNVVLETHYSEAAASLESRQPGSLTQIESSVDALLEQKNQKRASLGKPPMADYYRIFALLQEVSKAAFAALCSELTLVHTSHEIGEFSVTSFGQVDLELGLISKANVAPFLGE